MSTTPAPRILVRGDLRTIADLPVDKAALTATVAVSPYADEQGRHYVVTDEAVHSQRPVFAVRATGEWTCELVWAAGTAYRISAPGYMPDVLVYCDTLTPPVDGSAIEVAAKDLIDVPGGATPVEWVTLTAVIAGIDAKVAAAAVAAVANDPTIVDAAVDRVVALTTGDLGLAHVVIGKNLYNPADADVMPGYGINFGGSYGAPVASAAYTLTGFIPVTAGAQYTLSNPRSLCFYTAAKAAIAASGVDVPSQVATTATVPASAAYVRASFHTANFGPSFQVEAGGSATAYEAFTASVPGLTVNATAAAAKASADVIAAKLAALIQPTRNLIDLAAGLDGHYWSTAQSDPYPFGGYFASEKIPVTPGSQLTLQSVHNVAFFDAQGTIDAASYVGDGTMATKTITVPAGMRFVGVSFPVGRKPLAMLEVGSTASPWEPYGNFLPSLRVGGEYLNDRIAALGNTTALTVYRAGDDLTIRHGFDSTRDLIHPASLNKAGFGGPRVQLFNSLRPAVALTPKSSPMSDITGAARTVETLIHPTGDEISPIYAGGSYIGANHGWAAGPRLTMSAHGKTLADVGSRWSDGTSTYTLLKVLDANTLVLGGPYTVSAGRATVSITLPSGPLTHVSGATNTATITGTSVLEQIGPVSHTRSVVARIDGLPIRDGYSTGRELTIAETYTIVSYKGLIDWSQANVGSDPFANLTQIPSFARLSNTYRWEGRDVTVGQTVTALEPLSAVVQVTQAVPLQANGGTLTQYLPGATGTLGGVNLATEWAHSAMTGPVTTATAQHADSTDPIARTYNWRSTGAGVRDYGLVLGLLPMMDGKPAARLSNGAAGGSWFIPSSTKKMYPRLTNNKAMTAGQSVSGVAFRRYLSGEDGLAVPVTDGSRSWVLVDGATARTDAAVSVPEALGRGLTVVGSTNVTTSQPYITPGLTVTHPASGRLIAEARPDTTV